MSEKLNDTTLLQGHFESEYYQSLKNVLYNGNKNMDRTGVGTAMTVGQSITIDLNITPIPLLRGKFVSPVGAFVEAMWILMGRTDLAFLKDNGVNYWDYWVNSEGNFGPIYGAQMRNQNGTINPGSGIDQLTNVLNTLIDNPDSRRMIIDLWNPAEQHLMSLPPCHVFYQFHTFITSSGRRELQLSVYQRSADAFIGVPYDFMLFYWIGKFVEWFTGYEFTKIWCAFGNYHIYSNQHQQINDYFNNIEVNSKNIDFNLPIQHRYRLEQIFPEWKMESTELTSTQVNDLIEIFWSQKEMLTSLVNYSKDERYGLIKTPVAV